MFKMNSKWEIGVRVETRDNNHVKAQVVLTRYLYSNSCIHVVEAGLTEGYVWLMFTTTTKHEKQLYHDIEVMKMLGIDIRGQSLGSFLLSQYKPTI